MPGRKESQDETRRRLVASALVLFARAGVAATSLKAVAEHAGFSRGAVHGNWSSKDELVAAVAETVVAELAPQLHRALRSSLGPAKPSPDTSSAHFGRGGERHRRSTILR